jgi:hypothetical protein
MEDTIIGVIAIIAGGAAFIFRKQFVQGNIKFQNKTFGFHFKEQPKADTILVGSVGLAIIVFGILVLLGVWELG